jgi:hypothetical protein
MALDRPIDLGAVPLHAKIEFPCSFLERSADSVSEARGPPRTSDNGVYRMSAYALTARRPRSRPGA